MAIHGHTAQTCEKAEPNKGEREKFCACELMMSRFIKMTIPCIVPPSSRERAHPGNVKLIASWQSALVTGPNGRLGLPDTENSNFLKSRSPKA